MPKTQFRDGLITTPQFWTAINNPVYKKIPDNDGEIPYPDLEGLGVNDALDTVAASGKAYSDAISSSSKAYSDAIALSGKAYSDGLASAIRTELDGVSVVASAAYNFLRSHAQSTGPGAVVQSLPANNVPVFSINIPYGAWVIDGSIRFYVPNSGLLATVSAGLTLDGSLIVDHLPIPAIPSSGVAHITFPRHYILQSYADDKPLSITVSMSGDSAGGIVTACHLLATKVPQ